MFPGSQFPGKSTFPGIKLSGKLTFPRKLTSPGKSTQSLNDMEFTKCKPYSFAADKNGINSAEKY